MEWSTLFFGVRIILIFDYHFSLRNRLFCLWIVYHLADDRHVYRNVGNKFSTIMNYGLQTQESRAMNADERKFQICLYLIYADVIALGVLWSIYYLLTVASTNCSCKVVLDVLLLNACNMFILITSKYWNNKQSIISNNQCSYREDLIMYSFSVLYNLGV